MAATLWADRAAGFVTQDMPLPVGNHQWRTFADRLRYAADAQLHIADSNAHAGLLMDVDGEVFDDVWLWDAHHDCGYAVASYDEWVRRFEVEEDGGSWSCEDWMLVQKWKGASRLHYRFPDWHTKYRERGVALPDGVGLDARVDDRSEDPTLPIFDDVFVCRSGSWVPPWCDGQFAAFVDTFPLAHDYMQPELLDDDLRRPWGEKQIAVVNQWADAQKELLSQVAQVNAAELGR